MSVNCSADPGIAKRTATVTSQGRIDFCLAITLLLVLIPIVNTFIFLWGKKVAKFERLRVRRTVLVYTSLIGCLIHASVGPGFIPIGYGNFPCWLRSFLTMLVVPFFASGVVTRLMIFYFMNELSREIAAMGVTDILEEEEKRGFKQNRFVRVFVDLFKASQYLIFPSTQKSMSKQRLIRALIFVASAKGIFIFILVTLTPFFAVALTILFTNPIYFAGCTGCILSSTETYEIIIVALFFIVFGLVAAYRVNSYPDPWKLRKEAKYSLLFCFGAILGFILGVFAENSPLETWDYQFILSMSFVGYNTVQTSYQVLLAYLTEGGKGRKLHLMRSKRTIKKDKQKDKRITDSIVDSNSQVPSTFDGKLTVKAILANPDLLALFEKFLIAELGVESLSFLRATDEWKKSYYDISSSARISRAKQLYKVYIIPSGSFPINIPSGVVAELKQKLLKEGIIDVGFDLFDSARSEITDLLQIGALMRFQLTPQYKEFIQGNASNVAVFTGASGPV